MENSQEEQNIHNTVRELQNDLNTFYHVHSYTYNRRNLYIENMIIDNSIMKELSIEKRKIYSYKNQ